MTGIMNAYSRYAVARGALSAISTLCMIDVWGGLVESLHPLRIGGQLGLKPLSTSVGRNELVRWSKEAALPINYGTRPGTGGVFPPCLPV